MAEAWLHQDASVNVDVQSVAGFGTKMQAEINENFLPSIAEGIRPMMTVQAPFGGGVGLGEGVLFRDMHERNRQAARLLLDDVFRSLTAIGHAAAAVAAEYAAGDAESSATTEDVYNAFTPTTVTGPTTTGTMPTTMPAGPYAAPQPEPGNPPPPAGNDPDRYPSTANPDAAVVVAPGTAGEYTIPADNEGMRSCTPSIPQPTN